MSKLFKNRNVRKKQTNWQVLVYCKSKKSCLNLCSESPYKMLQYFVNIRYHLNHYVFLSYSLEAQLLVNQPSSHSQPGPGLIRTDQDQDWPGPGPGGFNEGSRSEYFWTYSTSWKVGILRQILRDKSKGTEFASIPRLKVVKGSGKKSSSTSGPTIKGGGRPG